MPEGDTIRALADRIAQRFAGQRVERTVVRDPRLVGFDAAGRVLDDADAYGKHLFLRFDDGRTLHAHLSMSGSFAVGPPSREPVPARRLELVFGDGRLTAESVPVLGVLATADENRITDPLGPDLCRPGVTPDPVVVAGRLTTEPDRPLAGALLDQRLVAGFGNVYANDLPFLFGVDPYRPVGEIDHLDELAGLGIAMIRVNAQRRVQNTVGRRLDRGATWVHGRGRRPCPVCGERLSYHDERHTPWGRSITWCPSCQPAAGDADPARAARLAALHPAVRRWAAR